MRVQSISGRRWLIAWAVSAVIAFALGSTEWAGRLFACPGQEGCLGGCMNINGDGQYADENYCEIVLCNLFVDPMAIFCRSSLWNIAGPNVQPVKDGLQIQADTSAQVDSGILGCDILSLQQAGTTGNPSQWIDHTICPPQT